METLRFQLKNGSTFSLKLIPKTTRLIYFSNGELVAHEDLPADGFPSSPSSAPWRFGLGTLPFALDESRLSRLPKSSDWIKKPL